MSASVSMATPSRPTSPYSSDGRCRSRSSGHTKSAWRGSVLACAIRTEAAVGVRQCRSPRSAHGRGAAAIHRRVGRARTDNAGTPISLIGVAQRPWPPYRSASPDVAMVKEPLGAGLVSSGTRRAPSSPSRRPRPRRSIEATLDRASLFMGLPRFPRRAHELRAVRERHGTLRAPRAGGERAWRPGDGIAITFGSNESVASCAGREIRHPDGVAGRLRSLERNMTMLADRLHELVETGAGHRARGRSTRCLPSA